MCSLQKCATNFCSSDRNQSKRPFTIMAKVPAGQKVAHPAPASNPGFIHGTPTRSHRCRTAHKRGNTSATQHRTRCRGATAHLPQATDVGSNPLFLPADSPSRHQYCSSTRNAGRQARPLASTCQIWMGATFPHPVQFSHHHARHDTTDRKNQPRPFWYVRAYAGGPKTIGGLYLRHSESIHTKKYSTSAASRLARARQTYYFQQRPLARGYISLLQ